MAMNKLQVAQCSEQWVLMTKISSLALWTILDTALLNGGYQINEGKAFSYRMLRSIKSILDIDSFDLLPEIDPKVEEDVPPEVNMEDFVVDDNDFDF